MMYNVLIFLVKIIYILVPITLVVLLIYIFFKEKDIIKFNKLTLPKIPYLKGLYVSGLDYKSGNMYITCDDDKINIVVENKDGIFYDTIKDIKEIKINCKPYNYVKSVVSDYETDYIKSSGVGKMTGDVYSNNKIKILKSYEINIYTNDKIINLITFKNPKLFFRR